MSKTMTPGYYMFKPMGYPIEVTADAQYLRMDGESVSGHIAPYALCPATLKDLILFGAEFDNSKIVDHRISWAEHEDAECWHTAGSVDEALIDARDQGLTEVWVSEKPLQPDPRGVFPINMCMYEEMLDRCVDDEGMHLADQLGWLDDVTDEQKNDLFKRLEQVMCQWLADTDHWPKWFVAEDPHPMRVPADDGANLWPPGDTGRRKARRLRRCRPGHGRGG